MDATTTTLAQLELHLWEAANILRGLVDATDFKTNIFPLLFSKRISDVHDEEYQAALAESGGNEKYARFLQNYRFQFPQECHWNDVRTVTTNVGQALQKAMRCIETANPETLYGIFGDAQWTNKDRLSEALLRDLIERVVEAYGAFSGEQGFAGVTAPEEIHAGDGNLSIPFYVTNGVSAKGGGGAPAHPDLVETLSSLLESSVGRWMPFSRSVDEP